MFPPLFLLHYDRSLNVQIVILILENFVQGRVLTSVYPYFLEFVPEVLFDRKFLKSGSLEDNIVFAFQHKAIDNEVFPFE